MRSSLTIVVCLTIGIASTLAVAWGCALWSPVKTGGPYWPDNDDRLWWREHAPSGFAAVPIQLNLEAGFGVRNTFMWEQPPGGPIGNNVLVVRSGWPLSCMTGASWVDRTNRVIHRRSIVSTPAMYWLARSRIIPLQPIWIGFVLDVIVFATFALASWHALRAVIRARRARSGLCRGCAYPVGDGGTCPECGLRGENNRD